MELKALREEDRLTPHLVFRDPYLLNFLGLKDSYAGKDLEAAIRRDMEFRPEVLGKLKSAARSPSRSRRPHSGEPSPCS